MKEIEKVVTEKAYQTGVGAFDVCLDTVLVNPKAPSGFDWDLPGVSETIGVVGAASEAMGEINRLGDSFPPLGIAMDAGMAYASNGQIDRHQAAAIAKLTAQISELASPYLPTGPDVNGQLFVGGAQLPFPYTEDSLRIDLGACARTNFGSGSQQAISVSMTDIDFEYHDPIGACAHPLAAVIERGPSGLPCGYSRLLGRATFAFSFDQIAVVGLPPPSETLQ
jgi:hypothetical protein